MEARKLLEVLSVAERLKDAIRHCYTSGGRRESVAEHSWRITLMAYLVSDEFPEADLTELPQPFAEEMRTLYREMDERKTLESRIYKALDNLEALIQHNESDISTWIPLEYDLQMTYGNDKVQFSEYLTRLRDEVRNDSKKKIAESIKKSD